jgi:hypothetical protein
VGGKTRAPDWVDLQPDAQILEDGNFGLAITPSADASRDLANPSDANPDLATPSDANPDRHASSRAGRRPRAHPGC